MYAHTLYVPVQLSGQLAEAALHPQHHLPIPRDVQLFHIHLIRQQILAPSAISPWRTHVDVKNMCWVLSEWHGRVCVCLNVAYMNSDCVPVYNIFLLHTAIEEQFYLSVSCKALWVMPPSFQVRLIFNKSCWLRKKHSHSHSFLGKIAVGTLLPVPALLYQKMWFGKMQTCQIWKHQKKCFHIKLISYPSAQNDMIYYSSFNIFITQRRILDVGFPHINVEGLLWFEVKVALLWEWRLMGYIQGLAIGGNHPQAFVNCNTQSSLAQV